MLSVKLSPRQELGVLSMGSQVTQETGVTPRLTSPCLAPEGGWSARDGLGSSRQKQPKIGTVAEGL